MENKVKINIEIRDNIKPKLALRLVANVIALGKISTGEHGKKYYCWQCNFNTADGEMRVSTRQYRKSDCFVVYKYVKNEHEAR